MKLYTMFYFFFFEIWLCISPAYSFFNVEQTMPIPLRTYRGPGKLIFGRAYVPKYTIQTKFNMNTGASHDCDSPPTLWSFAHMRYPFINFYNGSSPSSVYVVPNEFNLVVNGSMGSIEANSPEFGDWFWGVTINQSYKEDMTQSGLDIRKKCRYRAILSLIHTVADDLPLITSVGVAFELNATIIDSVVRRLQPPEGVFSVRLELLECESSNGVKLNAKSCPIVITYSQNSMPSIVKSEQVPSSNGLNVTWRYLRQDDMNFIRVTSTDSFYTRVKLRFVSEESCALEKTLIDALTPQPEGCIIFSQLNRFVAFLTRFQYYFSYDASTDMANWTGFRLSSNRLIIPFQILHGEDQGATLRVAMQQILPSISAQLIPHNQSVYGINISDFLALMKDEELTQFNFSVQHDLTPNMRIRVSICISHTAQLSNESCIARLDSWSNQERRVQVFLPYPRVGLTYLNIWRKCFLENDSVACPNVSTVLVQASAQPCVRSKCGDYGNCILVSSRDVLMSACDCKWGYSGFGCTDSRYAVSLRVELFKMLCLTLSNVFFIPSIIIAVRRRYFVQALVYFYIMTSSTLYHLCDSDTPYSVCVLQYDVLSFCDFYGAIMTIWVTLVAMACMARGVAELMTIAAALGLVIGVVSDRHSLLAFLIPLLLGFAMLMISWGRHWYKKRKCFPHRKWWLMGMLPGCSCAVAGVILFAFFETKANYAYVHSLWHVFISVSVVFILPWTPAPPLWQRGTFLSFNAIQRTSDLDANESPLFDTERVSMPQVNTVHSEEEVPSTSEAT